jgi:hypothetical protein
VQPFVVASFSAPRAAIAAAYVFTIVQIFGCYQLYCRPTFDLAYDKLKRSELCSRGTVLMNVVVTTTYMVAITFICCLLPFFGCVACLCASMLTELRTPGQSHFMMDADLPSGPTDRTGRPCSSANI